MVNPMSSIGKIASQVFLLYLLWFVSCALLYPHFVLLPNAFRSVAIVFGADQWSLPAVQRFSIFFLMILSVIFMFWTEFKYRKASKIGAGRLLRVFAWVTGGHIVLAAVGYFVPRMLL